MFDGLSNALPDVVAELADFVLRRKRLLVLTGAGISTASGIPDYRDDNGEWKQASPIQYQDFLRTPLAQQRYWARSAIGWPRFSTAQPSRAHHALCVLQDAGHVYSIITQNVDGLHQRAGSQRVIDLHGRLDQVMCLDCGRITPREALQVWLIEHNPQLQQARASAAPDGDARLENLDFASIRIPLCEQCNGRLKPNVVFFGENVPAERVAHSFNAVENADALLVVGSSLMVYSGYRFVKRAHELGIPVAAINRGVTRADDLLDLKFALDCDSALSAVTQRL
jgi:NAD-dependent SIR2 family protein deacetylase